MNLKSVFQSNKAISDNIWVAFETFHHMKSKKFGNLGFITLKLDISKTYNRFLFFVFLRMNLCNFININDLHPNVKMEQYEMKHPPSILENLICV